MVILLKVSLERAERRNQDARGGFLADPPARPALLLRPFLQRTLPTDDMPQARARRRGDAADRADRAPHRGTRRLDTQSGCMVAAAGGFIAKAQPRQIEGTERVELSQREAVAEILSSLPHTRGDRPAPLHDGQRVDDPVRPGRAAISIGDCRGKSLNLAMTPPFRGDDVVIRVEQYPAGTGHRSPLRTIREQFGRGKPRTSRSNRSRKRLDGRRARRGCLPPTAVASASLSLSRRRSPVLPSRTWQSEWC